MKSTLQIVVRRLDRKTKQILMMSWLHTLKDYTICERLNEIKVFPIITLISVKFHREHVSSIIIEDICT